MRTRTIIMSIIILISAVVAVPIFLFVRGEYDRRYPPISFTDAAEQSAVLMNGVESYLSSQDFAHQLDAHGLAYQVNQPNPDSAPTELPVFEVTTVDIQSYSHLGYAGHLTVSFFNDRLSAMRFYPAEFDGYLAALRESTGVDLTVQPEGTPSDNVRMWSSLHHSHGRYVGWEDTRLKEEFDLWMKLYGFG